MKALVVDDSMVARTIIKKVLLSVYPNVELTEAKCANDAIKSIDASEFDIFTVDFNMPDATGDTVIEHAQKKCPDAKICLLTANKQLAMKEKCQEWGIELLEKPHFQAALSDFLQA